MLYEVITKTDLFQGQVPSDNIGEFSNITWPVVGFKLFDNMGWNLRFFPSFFLIEFHEVIDEQGQISYNFV